MCPLHETPRVRREASGPPDSGHTPGQRSVDGTSQQNFPFHKTGLNGMLRPRALFEGL